MVAYKLKANVVVVLLIYDMRIVLSFQSISDMCGIMFSSLQYM